MLHFWSREPYSVSRVDIDPFATGRQLIIDPQIRNLTLVYALFFIEGATPIQDADSRHGLDFRYERHGHRNSVERVVREVKQRTSSFSNCFSHADAETANEWLRSFAFAWNQLI